MFRYRVTMTDGQIWLTNFEHGHTVFTPGGEATGIECIVARKHGHDNPVHVSLNIAQFVSVVDQDCG